MYFTNPLIPCCYIYVITNQCKSTLHHLADRQTLQSESTLLQSESTLHHWADRQTLQSESTLLQSESTLPNWLAGLNTAV